MYRTVYLVIDLTDEEESFVEVDSSLEADSHAKEIIKAYLLNDMLEKHKSINLELLTKELKKTGIVSDGHTMTYSNGDYKVKIAMAQKKCDRELTPKEKQLQRIMKGW